MEYIRCEHCGVQNNLGDEKCACCGHSLPTSLPRNRTTNISRPSKKIVYVDDPGSYAAGFALGFLLGLIGFIIGCAINKSETKRGCKHGFLTFLIIDALGAAIWLVIYLAILRKN